MLLYKYNYISEEKLYKDKIPSFNKDAHALWEPEIINFKNDNKVIIKNLN